MNAITEFALSLWQSGRKTRSSSNGWLSGNSTCCHNRGHAADRRGRGGVIVGADEQLNYSCFNCGFKTGYQPGSFLSDKFTQWLHWSGADHRIVEQLKLEAWRIKNEISTPSKFTKEGDVIWIPRFPDTELPDNVELLDPQIGSHQSVSNYLVNRGIDPLSYPFMATPTAKGRDANRVIIPYFYNSRIVGHTSRFLDDRQPKYISHSPLGYVFNLDAQSTDWAVCLVTEGQFDALSIGGCAIMGSTIGDEQAQLLKRLNKQVIVIPDHDAAGMKIIPRALELNFAVAIPNWHSGVKDCNAAVKRYGRLATTLSILQSATTSKITLELKKRKFT